MSKRNRGRPRIKFDVYNVKFSVDAFLKMKKFCEIAGNDEWLCFLLKDKNNGVIENTINVSDLYFPPQIVSGGNCSLKGIEFAKEIEKMIKTKQGQETLQRFCGWMHSHNTMQPFFSVTDDDANKIMRNYISASKVFISLVVNNAMQFDGKAIIKMKTCEEEIDDVNVFVDFENIDKIEKLCRKLWNKKVERDTYVYKEPKTDVLRIPRKYIGSLTKNLVYDVYNAEFKVYYVRNLESSIKQFLNRRKLTRRQRKAVRYLFRAFFFNKLTKEEALMNFAKDFTPSKTIDKRFVSPKETQSSLQRQSGFTRQAKRNFSLWFQDYDDNSETFEEYKRRKQMEDDTYGFY